MKKTLAILTLATLSFGAFAAPVLTDSDTLLLKGKVEKKVSIVVTPEANAILLDLTASPVDLKVAEVTEKANVTAGYTVTITSANAGKLVNEDDNTESINYTLKYNGAAIELASPSAGNNEVEYLTKQLQPVDRDVTISYVGDDEEDLLAGDYSDTVTFGIAAN